jgi:hypothetical protein
MSTAIQKATTSALEKATAEITKTLEGCTMDIVAKMPAMQQALVLATGYKAMRAALTDEIMRELFIPLMGSRIGFRTDRDRSDKGPYSIEIVRICLIDAMIEGARPVGNEFNIIAENAYFTKEFFERKIEELPDLTDVVDEPGVPQMRDGGALVPYTLKYIYKGVRGEIVRGLSADKNGVATDTRIPVRVNSGQGADAILGKAKRKIYCQLYKRLTGSKISDGDVIDTTGEEVPDLAKPSNEPKAGTDAKVDELYEKHRTKGAAAKNGKTEESAASQQDPAAQQSIPNT